MEIIGVDIHRYEIGIIVNENRSILHTTDNLEEANDWYESAIAKFAPENNKNHVIIFLYDYDKNANINYYDSEFDI